MTKPKKIFLFVTVSLLLLTFAINAFAFGLKDAFNTDDSGTSFFKVADKTNYNLILEPTDMIGTIIFSVMSILGIIFIVLMVYGGYLWMTAMGKETQLTRAKDLIQEAVIGIVIMVAAYAISYFVTSVFVSPFMKKQQTGAPVVQPYDPNNNPMPNTEQSPVEMNFD